MLKIDSNHRGIRGAGRSEVWKSRVILVTRLFDPSHAWKSRVKGTDASF